MVEDVIVCIYNVGVKEVVVKCGVDFCLVFIVGEGLVDVLVVKLLKEKVIDIIVVGDFFSVGYLVVCLIGGSVEDVVKCGYLIVSIVI